MTQKHNKTYNEVELNDIIIYRDPYDNEPKQAIVRAFRHSARHTTEANPTGFALYCQTSSGGRKFMVPPKDFLSCISKAYPVYTIQVVRDDDQPTPDTIEYYSTKEAADRRERHFFSIVEDDPKYTFEDYSTYVNNETGEYTTLIKSEVIVEVPFEIASKACSIDDIISHVYAVYGIHSEEDFYASRASYFVDKAAAIDKANKFITQFIESGKYVDGSSWTITSKHSTITEEFPECVLKNSLGEEISFAFKEIEFEDREKSLHAQPSTMTR